MNRQTARATFVATIGVTLALVSTTALAGKPAPQPSPDPCAATSPDFSTNWAGFPAYAYTVFDSKTYTTQIRVASRNGACSKRVGPVLSGRAGSTSFARDPDSWYVIAFYGGGGGAMLAKFAPGGFGETTTYIPATFVTFRSDTTGTLDLAPDGTQLAYERTAATYTHQLFVANLSDLVGGTDILVQSFNNTDSSYMWWAPWGRIYYTETNLDTGKRLQSVDPLFGDSQTPDTILQMAANDPLVVNKLSVFAQISGGYVSDASGVTPYIVFQGSYTTGIKRGGLSGSWCAATYAINADNGLFLIGSIDSPSSITGFYPSVTGNGTVLFEKSTAPTSGSSCTRTGYVGESALAPGYTTSISGLPPGSWPAALKTHL